MEGKSELFEMLFEIFYGLSIEFVTESMSVENIESLSEGEREKVLAYAQMLLDRYENNKKTFIEEFSIDETKKLLDFFQGDLGRLYYKKDLKAKQLQNRQAAKELHNYPALPGISNKTELEVKLSLLFAIRKSAFIDNCDNDLETDKVGKFMFEVLLDGEKSLSSQYANVFSLEEVNKLLAVFQEEFMKKYSSLELFIRIDDSLKIIANVLKKENEGLRKKGEKNAKSTS